MHNRPKVGEEGKDREEKEEEGVSSEIHLI
jgi:hypothetical protein